MVLQDYNEVTQAGSKSFSNPKDRPHSGGPSGRRGTVLKTSSISLLVHNWIARAICLESMLSLLSFVWALKLLPIHELEHVWRVKGHITHSLTLVKLGYVFQLSPNSITLNAHI